MEESGKIERGGAGERSGALTFGLYRALLRLVEPKQHFDREGESGRSGSALVCAELSSSRLMTSFPRHLLLSPSHPSRFHLPFTSVRVN